MFSRGIFPIDDDLSEIARQLQARVHIDLEAQHDNDSNTMSLMDKMSLWDEKMAEADRDDSSVELFEGITEDDPIMEANNIMSHKYRQLTLDSPAYDWLLQSLQRHATLDSYNHTCNAQVVIHRTVLEHLRSDRLNRHTPPIIHQAIFDLAWSPNISSADGDIETQVAESLGKQVLVSAGDMIQAVTVAQYFSQTWSMDDSKLTGLLRMMGFGTDMGSCTLLYTNPLMTHKF